MLKSSAALSQSNNIEKRERALFFIVGITLSCCADWGCSH